MSTVTINAITPCSTVDSSQDINISVAQPENFHRGVRQNKPL